MRHFSTLSSVFTGTAGSIGLYVYAYDLADPIGGLRSYVAILMVNVFYFATIIGFGKLARAYTIAEGISTRTLLGAVVLGGILGSALGFVARVFVLAQ